MVFKRGRFVLVVTITLSQQAAHVMMISVVQTCMVIGEEDTCIFLLLLRCIIHHLKITIPIFSQRIA